MENTYAYYNDDSALYAIFAVYVSLLIFCLIVGLIQAIGLAFCFKKSGKPAWGAFVPFYNLYLTQITAFDKKYWPFVFLILLPAVNGIYWIYVSYAFARSYGLSVGASILYIFFSPIMNFYIGLSSSVEYQGTEKFILE